MGTPDRAIAPIPNADGNMTVPNHIQLLASAPTNTGLECYGPSYEPQTYPCTVLGALIPTRSLYLQKCSVIVNRLSYNLAYIQRCLNRGFPVVVTTFVDGHINEIWN